MKSIKKWVPYDHACRVHERMPALRFNLAKCDGRYGAIGIIEIFLSFFFNYQCVTLIRKVFLSETNLSNLGQ